MMTIAKPLPHVTVVQLPVDALHALAAGDRATASALAGLDVPDELVEPTNRDTWVRRSWQVSTDPRHQDWVTGLPVDVDSGCVVGNAGFHAFTEKVLATNLADARAIATAVRASSIVFTISFPRKTIGPMLLAKAMIDGGELGDVTALRIRFTVETDGNVEGTTATAAR